MSFNKNLYFLLSFTWGLPMTLIGCIVAFILTITGHKPTRFLYGWCFHVTNNSGVSFGPFSIVAKNPTQYLLKHEFGHSIQNCFLGPFMVFLVAIPSFIRFWYREYLVKAKGGKYSDLPAYDSIWFEGSATNLGEKCFKYLGDEDEQN